MSEQQPTPEAKALYEWLSAQTTPVTMAELAAAGGPDNRAAHQAIAELEMGGSIVLLPATEWRRNGITQFNRPPTRAEHHYYATRVQLEAWARPYYSVMWMSHDEIGSSDPDAWTRGYAFRGLTINDNAYDITGIVSDEFSRTFWTGRAHNAPEAYCEAFTQIAFDEWDMEEYDRGRGVEDVARLISEVHAFIHTMTRDLDPTDPEYVASLIEQLNSKRHAREGAA
ncbi:hypothetical protein [Streptomyces sp. cg35]|uniref:hypothetical protein n=1 Tax=Streptomyces sp. cg35 TaxID=3421650 RepID=UPI003D186F76